MSYQKLDWARAQWVSRFATQTCSIQRYEQGDADGYGGRTNRYETVQTGKACRAQRATRPLPITEGAQHTSLTQWEVLFPVGTVDLQVKDRILIDGDNGTYEVQGHDANTAGGLNITAYCTRKGVE